MFNSLMLLALLLALVEGFVDRGRGGPAAVLAGRSAPGLAFAGLVVAALAWSLRG